jgi:hypothetical protein
VVELANAAARERRFRWRWREKEEDGKGWSTPVLAALFIRAPLKGS